MHRTSARIYTALSLLLACGPPKSGDDAGSDGSSTDTTTTIGHSSTPTDPGPDPDPDPDTGSPPDPTVTTVTTTTTTTPDPDTPTSSATDPAADSIPLFEEDTVHSFVVEPLDLPPGDCDPWSDSCPQGSKCAPVGQPGSATWDQLQCVPLPPAPRAPGEPCTVQDHPLSGLDDCQAHAMCWDVDADLQGECVALCDGDSLDQFCADLDSACMLANDYVVQVCLPRCDPLLSDCLDGQVCIPTVGDFACVPALSPPSGDLFTPCDAGNSCDPGQVCADPDQSNLCNPDAAGCCLPFCDLAAPVCPPNHACTPWFKKGSAPPEFTDVGLCVAP